MSKALFIIDIQNDFTEGGTLGVEGGASVAARITELLQRDPSLYDHIIASRDWHDGDNDNGGHFSDAPDFVDSWPRHCVAGTDGAEYDSAFDTSRVEVHVRKGQGRPAYSIFDGTTDGGETLPELLERLAVTDIDVAGIATDYCVLASGLDAIASGRSVRILTGLVAGVDATTSAAALERLSAAGAELVDA